MSNGTMAITKKERMDNLKSILEMAKPTIQAMLPKHLTPDRLLKLAVMAANDQPLLLKADPMSIVKCAIISAQLGLEPNTPLGEAWILPYTVSKKNEKGEWVKVVVAQFIPGYQGLIKLARNSGEISTIEARVVYEKDIFEVEYGLNQKLRHVPYLEGDPGAIRFAYGFSRLKDGSFQIEPLSRRDFDKIKASSQSKDSKYSPYANWEDEMWRKGAIKRLCKYLPKTAEMARAINFDNLAEAGEVQVLEVDGQAIPVDETMALAEHAEGTTETTAIEEKEAGTNGTRATDRLAGKLRNGKGSGQGTLMQEAGGE